MRPLFSISFLVATVLATSAAHADVKTCVANHEKGQQARASGKLRDARELFLACASDSCPGAIRQDCAKWADDIGNRMPSVVIGAKDRGGRDLFDVKVTVDDKPFVEKLDGKSVAVDPGAHTFKFEAAGMPTVTQRVLVKEGERARPIDVVFEGGAPPSPTTTTETNGTRKDTGVQVATEKRGAGVLPWVVVGIGGVGVVGGLVYALTAPALPAGCDNTRQTCTRFDGESQESFDKRRDQAGKHDSQATTGFIVAGAGAVVLAGGVIWVILASSSSSSPKKASATPIVVPWVSAESGGLSAVARF